MSELTQSVVPLTEGPHSIVTSLDSDDSSNFHLGTGCDLSELWEKLLNVIKKLRNLQQDYAAQKQQLSWELTLSSYEEKLNSIDEEKKAALVGGSLGLVGTVLGAGVAGGIGALGGGIEAFLGSAPLTTLVADSFSQLGTISATNSQAWAEIQSAQADLLGRGSDSYGNSMMDLLHKAKQEMDDLFSAARELNEEYKGALQALYGRT